MTICALYRPRFDTVLLILAIFLVLPLPVPAEAFFTEDFNSSTQNPNLEPYSPYYAVTGGVIHRVSPEAFDDRRYLRTVLADYNERDFTFELTFTCKEDIIWIGIGAADRNSAYHEPQQSVVFWIRPTSIGGGVGFNTALGGGVSVDRVYSAGPHRMRIEKIGKRITFELDEKFDGEFKGDILTRLMDLDEVGPFLTSSNSHLFFGGVSAAESYDDLVIEEASDPAPDCNRNGVQDDVDLAAGTSVDASGDGIPDECQAAHHYFVDDFDVAQKNASLEGYGNFFYVADGYLRRTATAAFDDRHYLRTVQTDYNERNFVFEITFTIKEDGVFIGIGEAGLGAAYNEPRNSINFRCHPLSAAEGYIGVTTAQGEVNIGNFKTAGPHRARIEKKGTKVTFSIDDSYDGTFQADMSRAFNDLSVIAPFLNDRNSHLFFGNASPVEVFDDLSITETLDSGPDCNANGIADARDVQEGTSSDLNVDGVPDECQSLQGRLELATEIGTGIVRVMVTNNTPIRGGEIGLSYDPSVLLPIEVRRGADLPMEAEIHENLSPQISCPELPTVSAGLTVGWINSSSGVVLTPAGTHELLEIVFAPSFSQFVDGCFPIRFVTCLGVPAAPVSNILTGADGKSLLVAATDGDACVTGRPVFRRGDANGDTRFDISDPILILGCLFLGTDCPACGDASDANDDGFVNIADPSYLLNWRFLTGSEPPPPFLECGADVTADELEGCEGFPGCQ